MFNINSDCINNQSDEKQEQQQQQQGKEINFRMTMMLRNTFLSFFFMSLPPMPFIVIN
jgi:hypothetical protein